MNTIAIYENEMLEDTDKRPAFYNLCASYLRAFRHNRHIKTNDSMPADKKLTLACRKLYQSATATERAVMTGNSDLPPRQQARIFELLIYRLALMAGRTAIFIPVQYEPKGEKDDEQFYNVSV